jgi:hypothetical protein
MYAFFNDGFIHIFSKQNRKMSQHYNTGSRESSVYGLDGRGIGVSFLSGTRDFFFPYSIQTGSGGKPGSCIKGTVNSLSGGESGPDLKLTSHLQLLLKSRKRGAIPPLISMSSRRDAQLNPRKNVKVMIRVKSPFLII